MSNVWKFHGIPINTQMMHWSPESPQLHWVCLCEFFNPISYTDICGRLFGQVLHLDNLNIGVWFMQICDDLCRAKCRVALRCTAFQDFIIAKELLERPGAPDDHDSPCYYLHMCKDPPLSAMSAFSGIIHWPASWGEFGVILRSVHNLWILWMCISIKLFWGLLKVNLWYTLAVD